MKTLVAVASKHGSTMEIGERIAAILRESKVDVEVQSIVQMKSIAGYDAAIIGSGVYMGRWLGDARDFVDEHVSELSRMPVWMFSSGPITDKVDPGDAADGIRLLEAAHGREHRLFAGRLQKESLGLMERTIVRMVHPVYGDYRPWAEIDEWAKSIAGELTAVPA
ncbi:MAG TPA: flavodoxin domain-containing protein [Candidatus Limnocylindrales bacterium]